MTHVTKSTAGSDSTVESGPAGDGRVMSEEHEGLSITPQLSPTSYKQRSEEFKKTFKELSESERLIVDYNCALQKDILLQGRLFLTEHWVCFYSNVFWGTKIMVNMKDIASMSREKTARLIPNAIQIIQINTEKLFFTSFTAREKSYLSIFRIWQNFLLEKETRFNCTRVRELQLPAENYRQYGRPEHALFASALASYF